MLFFPEWSMACVAKVRGVLREFERPFVLLRVLRYYSFMTIIARFSNRMDVFCF